MSARGWFGLTCAGYWIAWVVAAGTLPERVPLHFSGSGAVDRWGTRTEALVTFAVIGVALAALLGGAALLSDRIPLSMVNTPRKDWWTATPERVRELRRRNRDDMWVIGAATMGFLVALLLETLRSSHLDEPRLGALFFVLFAVYVVFVVGWAIRMHIDRKATDMGDADDESPSP